MFRERVVEHYQTRGYQIQEDARVRADSGAVFPCDLMVQGPLGNLVVDFSPEGDGLEIGSLRRKAKELGASAVLAAPTFPPAMRAMAVRCGVVLLDEETLSQPAAEPEAAAAPQHPWPGPPGKAAHPEGGPETEEGRGAWADPEAGAPRARPLAPAAATLWRRQPPGAPARPARFSWLAPPGEPPAAYPQDGDPEGPPEGPPQEPDGPPDGARAGLAPPMFLDPPPGAVGHADAATAPPDPRRRPEAPAAARHAPAAARPQRPGRGRLLTRAQAAQAALAGLVAGAVLALFALGWLLL